MLDDAILRHLTLQLTPQLREYRKQKSLAGGNTGETIITSATEIIKESLTAEAIPDDVILQDDVMATDSEAIPEIELPEVVPNVDDTKILD